MRHSITRACYDRIKDSVVLHGVVEKMNTHDPIFNWVFLDVQSDGPTNSSFKLMECTNTGIRRVLSMSEYYNKTPDAPRVLNLTKERNQNENY